MNNTENNLLKNKKGLIVGIANDRSLAWGIAESDYNYGGQSVLTYQNEALKKRILPLAERIESNHVYECDVQDYSKLPNFFKNIEEKS